MQKSLVTSINGDWNTSPVYFSRLESWGVCIYIALPSPYSPIFVNRETTMLSKLVWQRFRNLNDVFKTEKMQKMHHKTI